MNKILRKVRKIFYRYQIRPGPRFGRLQTKIIECHTDFTESTEYIWLSYKVKMTKGHFPKE